MKFNMLFLSLMFILALAPAYAQTLETVYQQNTTLLFTRPCYSTTSSNGFCPSTTTCSLTVSDNKNTIITSNKTMTNQIFFHNATLYNVSNGVYRADMACGDSSTNLTGSDSFYFGVNDAGSDYSNNYLMFFIVGMIFIIMVVFFFLAYMLNDGLRLPFVLLGFLMLPVGLWFAMKLAANSFVAIDILNILNFAYIASLTGFIAMILYGAWALTMGLTIKKDPVYGAKVYKDRNNKGDRY